MADASGSTSPKRCDNFKIVITPEKSRCYVPMCDPDLKPFIDKEFPTLKSGIEFYRRYAGNCGFDIRLGTTKRAPDNSIMWKYVFCNKEGEKNLNVGKNNNDMESEKSSKRRASTRIGCKALIKFRITSGGGYVVKHFEEKHTHPLCSEINKKFMKMNRNMNPGHQKFVLDCARVNIGATKAYRLYKEVVGGYSNIGCTNVEFKNFSRDLKAYVSGADAQMLLNNLFMKCEISPAFYFKFDVDDKDQLTRLFWSDPICRRNYVAFGDVVSFDATYSTNRYNMIFAPFTGIDNHRRIVTFGAGLLSREDADSYAWLFEKFEDCMGRCPRMLITDQDLGMKTAIERVFPQTKHRLCMWHITNKIWDKLTPEFRKNSPLFRKKIDNIIWDELLEPAEFEKRWADIIDEFDLNDNSWFHSVFDMRRSWIPAYFRDFPLSGLLKTTSVSESVNSFFGRYFNRSSNLVEFFMQFESAVAAQRHAQDRLNSEITSSTPDLKTPLPIEKHALMVYTTNTFLENQSEIFDACFKCRVLSIQNDGVSSIYKIHDGKNRFFDVLYNTIENTFVCSCKKFVRIGLLCCHVFVLFKNLNIDAIPDNYVLSRWTKDATLKVSSDFGIDVNNDGVAIEENKMSLSRLYGVFYSCVGLVDGNPDKIDALYNHLRDYEDSNSNVECSSTPLTAKRKLFENYCGTNVPDVVSVLNPAPVKTKGSGRRIKSSKEKAIESYKKALRLCRKCNQRTNHDSRNCDKVSGGAS